jgi:hypothetical protein
MTKRTTNLLGIIITILAGIYFFVMYCSECGLDDDLATIESTDLSIATNAIEIQISVDNSKDEVFYKNN